MINTHQDPYARASTHADHLTSVCDARTGRYIRNVSYYMYSGNRHVDLWSPDVDSRISARPARGTDGIQTTINIIKSCIDTLVSKMSQTTVRPVFNTVDGDFDSRQIAKTLQHNFDIYYDEQHADPKLSQCFRDACICDYGVMYMNPRTRSMERVAPWKYNVNPAEYEAGAITEIVKWERKTPLAKYIDSIDNKKLLDQLKENPQITGKMYEYWDLYNGYKYDMFGSDPLHDPEKLETECYGGLYRRPFVEIWYRKPMKGFTSESLADDLYPIQRNIDSLVARLDNATRNAIIAMGFIPEGISLKPSMIENGYKLYQVPAEGANGVKFITPPVIDEMFVKQLNDNIDRARELSGLSELSVSGTRPNGVDSGKAFQTLQDIESDRFNTQLQQYSHFKIDCARVAIDCFPADEAILERKFAGENITWGEARTQRKLYTLQFAPADMLSKDPAEKFQEIQALQQMGQIDGDEIASLLQIPDLEGAISHSTASYQHVCKIVNEAIKKGEMEYDETVDLNMLLRETLKQINMMNVAGDSKKYIDRAKELLIKVNGQLKAIAAAMAPPPPQSPFEPLRDYSLDQGQIDHLIGLVKDVVGNAIPVANAIAIATAAYPKIPMSLLQQMFEPPQQPAMQQ